MLARDGVPYQSWTEWTLDQIDLYLEGRKLNHEKTSREVDDLAQKARLDKRDPLIRYVIPLE